MEKYRLEFIKDFLKEHPNKEELRRFISTQLPISREDRHLLIQIYCTSEKGRTPLKVVAFNLNKSEDQIKKDHKKALYNSLPYFNLFFHQALNTTLN